MKISLQLKLLIGFMLVISLTMGTVLLGISLFIKDQVISEKQDELLKKGMDLSHSIQLFQEETGNLDKIDDYLANADKYIDARIWILDKSRQLAAASVRHNSKNKPSGLRFGEGQHITGNNNAGMIRSFSEDLDAVYSGETIVKVMEPPFYGEKMVIVALPLKQVDGSISGALLLNSPISGIDAFLERIYYYIGAGSFLALLLAFLIANYLTRTIARPLKAMQEAAHKMSHGDYATRVSGSCCTEFEQLGDSLNALAEDLALYMDEAEKTEEIRREFVANVSHELRTPLTIMRGYTEALIDGLADNPEETIKYLKIMREETVRLELLVNELLDLSQIQNELNSWPMELLPFEDIASSVLQMLKQRADENRITLSLTTASNLPPILGNGDRLTQLLLILLDNALKYTPPNGTVAIDIQKDCNALIVSVIDTGAGIAKHDQPYIWDRFYKADKSHTRGASGAGLGLSIAKQILERHQASATIVSTPQQGSSFVLRIQFA